METDPRGPRFGAAITTFDLCLDCQVYLFIQRNLSVRPSD
jgi:hypothetical protein